MELKQKADVEQENQAQKEAVEAVYKYAAQLMQNGLSSAEVESKLVEQGLDKESAGAVVKNLNDYLAGKNDGDGGAMGWLVWIGILIGINLLSYIFDWPFWIY